MTNKFWLALESSPGTPQIDFTNPDVLVIPIVPLQTGGSRTTMTPGLYRSPRIRSGATKFGSATNMTDAKEISFPALFYGRTMDDIYAKWKQIQFYLDRAEIAASPFPRGTGIVFVEQINDSIDLTMWDVTSGVLTDVDFNLPDVDIEAGLLQLAVLPFSRGYAQTTAFGSTRSNGTGSTYYLPYPGGDAPGLFELRVKDLSAAGHEITWLTIGRRWYPTMPTTDFTPWYTSSGLITTTQSWQQISSFVSAAGNHQTGLFGVYAVVTDASLVVGDPTNINISAILGGGTIDNGFMEIVLVPKDGAGSPASATARQLVTFTNPQQPGDVQDSEDFESNTWNSWLTPPQTAVASGGTAALTIDATAAIVGQRGAHFKVTGNSSSGSITSASATRLMPNITAQGQQSLAFKINPVSWGSWVSATPVSAPSAPSASASAVTGVSAPGAPSCSFVNTGFGFAAGTQTIAYTWSNGYGETTLGTPSIVAHGATNGYIGTIIPTLPAGVNRANIYVSDNGAPYALWGYAVAGTYHVQPPLYPSITPPSTNTTTPVPNFVHGVTYFVGLTWLTIYGQTTVSALTSFTVGGADFDATVTVPAFPANVVQAGIWVSTTASASVSFNQLVSSPGVVSIQQGDSVHVPPASNTSGTPGPGTYDASARFTWGSLSLVTTGTQNQFALQISGTQVGSAFPLLPGVIHQIGASFQILGTQGVYTLIVDNTIIGGHSDSISATFLPPVTATFTAVAAGTGGPYTEEWYLDEIHVYDSLLQPGFTTDGSSASIIFTTGANTASVDLYYAFHGPNELVVPVQWYQIQNVTSSLVIASKIPINAVPVTGPPTVAPVTSYAQLQARVGVGSAPSTWLPKSVVRTKVASGAKELVRLGTIEMPPGAKADMRNLDPWTLAVWGKSGAANSATLAISGLYLFPEDEYGHTDITASAYGDSTNGVIWHVGTNRFGRSYAQRFASDGTTLLGYANVDGAIGSMAGDQNFVVLTGRLNANGAVLIDNSQSFQLSHQVIARQHFESTAAGHP